MEQREKREWWGSQGVKAFFVERVSFDFGILETSNQAGLKGFEKGWGDCWGGRR